MIAGGKPAIRHPWLSAMPAPEGADYFFIGPISS
jgi:hypothetical protein